MVFSCGYLLQGRAQFYIVAYGFRQEVGRFVVLDQFLITSSMGEMY